MKLYVTKTNDPGNAIALAEQFFCKTEVQENEIIITKNSQLTDDEFTLLAGKLVMYGFNVVCQEVAEFNQRREQVNREHEQRRKQTEKEYRERQTQKKLAAEEAAAAAADKLEAAMQAVALTDAEHAAMRKEADVKYAELLAAQAAEHAAEEQRIADARAYAQNLILQQAL